MARFPSLRPFNRPAFAIAAGCIITVPAFATPTASAHRSVAVHTLSGDTAVTVVELTPKQGKLSDLLKAAAAKADSLKRTPFIEVGATWCPQCRELASGINDKRMVEAFTGTYIIRLDFDEWKGSLDTLGYKITAVPVFFAVGPDGKATSAGFTTDPLGHNTPENVAAPLKKFFSGHLKKKSS